MSADSWEKCPICKSEKIAIREDIDYGIDDRDGTAYVDFRANCIMCGARWKIKVKGIKHLE